jgi:hypothetical protein
MCLACEQDAMWFAYLRRRGLIDENGEPVEPVPSIAYPIEVLSAPEQTEEQVEEKVEQSASEPAEKSELPFDDPKAG